jgi:hypothetical protein
MIRNTAIFGCFCFGLIGQANAQIEEAGMELVKPFRAKLAESKKFVSSPALPRLDTQAQKKLDYVVPTHLQALQYPAPTIQPLFASTGKKNEGAVENYGFYTKAGFGYPISPLLEVSFHSRENKNYKFGAGFKHHSGRGNFNPNQRFSKTGLGIEGAYYTEKGLALDGAFGFALDGVRFFGDTIQRDSISTPTDSLLQNFTHIFGQIGIFNGKKTDLALNYRGNLGFYSLSDKYNSKEFGINPTARVEKFFGTTHKHLLGADLGLAYANFSNLDSSQSRLLVYFKPNFTYHAGWFKAKVGANVGTSEGKFYAYPDIEAVADISEGNLSIYGGWAGEVRQNTFRTLTNKNPFIISTPNLHHSNWQDFYGGLRGVIKKVNYDARILYSRVNNLPIFMNDSLASYRRFKVLYDTANIFGVSGRMDMELIKGLTLAGMVNFSAYSLKKLEKAYHLPNLEINASLQYQNNKFRAKAELYMNSGVAYFDNLTQTNKNLSGLFDLNIGASYFFTKNIAAFADINNLLNNQNQRWFRYPQIGFNAMAGVILKF